jgi:cell division protein FtsI/penicillin-binding protein 2
LEALLLILLANDKA